MSGPDTPAPKETTQNFLVPVALSDTLLGHQLTQKGVVFNADSLFMPTPELRSESPDQYSAVYLRTKDGNIYQITLREPEEGVIINSKASKSRQDKKVRVGEWFNLMNVSGPRIGNLFTWDYGGTRYTSIVTEVVGVLKQRYSSEEIEKLTKGKKSSILEDFGTDLIDAPMELTEGISERGN